MRKTLFPALSLLLILSFAHAQTYLNATGSPTFNTPETVELGYINLANGNLHLQVPFGSWPQRGAIGFSAGMVYDSRIWQIVNNQWQPTNVPNSMAGWRFATSVDAGSVAYMTNTSSCQGGTITTYSVFIWTDPNGTQRAFPITTSQNTCTGQNVTSGDAFASDSSGYHMYVTNYTSATVFAKNGNKVSPASEDTNGNFFSADANGNVIDTLGRKPVTKSTGVNQVFYDVTFSQAGTTRFTVNTETISVATNFGQSGVTEYSGNITAIQSIGLPDGSSYSFGYDTYGELNSVELRTGGTITYTYSNFSDSYGNINRWVEQRISAGGTWTYVPQVTSTCSPGTVGCVEKVTVTKPSGDGTAYDFTLNNGSWNTEQRIYNGAAGTGTRIRTLDATFDFSNACPFPGCFGAGYVRPMQINVTDPVPSNSIIKQTTYGYDSIFYGNVNAKKEWRYYTGSPSSTPDRETDTTFLTTSSYISKNIVNLPTDIIVKNGSGTQVAETKYSYDTTTLTSQTGDANHDDTNYGTGNTVRGNISQVLRWVSGASCTPNTVACLTTSQSFSTEGNLLSSTDPRGNQTSFSYSDAFSNDDGSDNPPTVTPNPPTHAQLTKITYPNSQTYFYHYYFGSGKPSFQDDENGKRAYKHYIDSLDRITLTKDRTLADGTSRPWVLYNYTSTTQTDSYIGIASTTPSVSCASCRHDIITYDSNGRLSRNTLASDPEGQTFVDTSYDTTGRVASVSNPYRTTTDPTYGLESFTYDGLDRQTRNTHQDTNFTQTAFGAAVSSSGGAAAQLCTTSTYGLGYPVLTIDEAGKKMQTWSDGFGRNIETDEPDSTNNLTVGTCYKYDALDNLTEVDQGSLLARTYVYDGLSRQTSSTEPESGVTTTAYSISGVLCSGIASDACTITDARNIATTYTYDSRDRLTGKSYSDSTHSVTYSYDQTSCNGLTITNGLNRRTCMTDAAGTTAWSYDPAGHIVTEKRTVGSITKSISNTYNLDGSVAQKTFPSTNILTYTYSNAQRVTAIQNTATGANYATSVTYAPHGEFSSMINGLQSGKFAGVTYSRSYNNRLQPTSSNATSSNGTAMNLSYSYDQGGGINNGNLVTMTNNKSGQSGRSTSYSYDTLNRVSIAQTTATSGSSCWGFNFGYDRYGNLLSRTKLSAFQTSCTNSVFTGAIIPGLTVDSHNHISGENYDAAGNLTQDLLRTNFSFTFDAESHMIVGNGTTYTIDGDGWRVKKSNGTLEWHDITCDGKLIDEFDLSGNLLVEYYYLGSMLIATRSFFYYGDNLQSVRVMTDLTGNVQWESDYHPHGAEVPVVTGSNNRKFTSKKRDTETVLDYSHLRMYNSDLARWPSVDPVSGDVRKPQELNGYQYVTNDPTRYTDMSGAYRDDGDDSRDFVERVPNDAHGAAPVCSGYGAGALGVSSNPPAPPLPPTCPATVDALSRDIKCDGKTIGTASAGITGDINISSIVSVIGKPTVEILHDDGTAHLIGQPYKDLFLGGLLWHQNLTQTRNTFLKWTFILDCNGQTVREVGIANIGCEFSEAHIGPRRGYR